MNDNEQRSIIQPQCLNFPDVRDLFQTLIEWINDELVEERIIVSNIEQDLYDGQVLHKLWEKLTGNKLNVLEVTQSEEGQRQKLTVVLNAVNHVSGVTLDVKPYLIYWLCLIYIFSDSRLPSHYSQMDCGKHPFKECCVNFTFARCTRPAF